MLRAAAERHGYDVALVLRDLRDLAAAQQVRRAGAGVWHLPPRLRALGERLGARGRDGHLAVFVDAAQAAGRPLCVLPFAEAVPGRPWLLELHGDAGRPDSVVLTREQHLRTGDHRAALSGVLHTLLLTRHVLFVGSSMLDDDLIRIAHEVRSALEQLGPDSQRRLGTVLALAEDPARARLWEPDVDTVGVGEDGDTEAEAARRLEVLPDLVGCLACPPAGYLLDPAYRGMLDQDEAALARTLTELDRQLHARPGAASAARQVDEVLARLAAHST